VTWKAATNSCCWKRSSTTRPTSLPSRYTQVQGRQHLRKTTRGWKLCVQWKDGSIQCTVPDNPGKPELQALYGFCSSEHMILGTCHVPTTSYCSVVSTVGYTTIGFVHSISTQ
jgi:hypothetical protein